MWKSVWFMSLTLMGCFECFSMWQQCMIEHSMSGQPVECGIVMVFRVVVLRVFHRMCFVYT